MTDASLTAIPAAVSDELESPSRRALRRLFQRKGAVAGLVVIAAFALLAMPLGWMEASVLAALLAGAVGFLVHRLPSPRAPGRIPDISLRTNRAGE